MTKERQRAACGVMQESPQAGPGQALGRQQSARAGTAGRQQHPPAPHREAMLQPGAGPGRDSPRAKVLCRWCLPGTPSGIHKLSPASTTIISAMLVQLLNKAGGKDERDSVRDLSAKPCTNHCNC